MNFNVSSRQVPTAMPVSPVARPQSTVTETVEQPEQTASTKTLAPKPIVVSRLSPPVVTEQEVHDIQSQGAKVPGETLKAEASVLPTPAALIEARGKLKAVTTRNSADTRLAAAKEEYLKDNQTLEKTTIATHTVDQKHVEGDISGLIKGLDTQVMNFKTHLHVYAHSQEPVDFLAQQLKGAMKQLDATNTTLRSSTRHKEIDAVVANTETQVTSLISSLSSNIDLSFHLRHMEPKQLEKLVTQAIGQNKGYDDEKLATLSDKKIQFRDAVIRGIQAGLQNQNAQGLDTQGKPVLLGQEGQLHKDLQAMQQAAKASVAALHPDSPEVWGLTMKSNPELREHLVSHYGVQKQPVIDHLLKGLLEGLPNKVSAQTTEINPGLHVPSEIQLNGKTYNCTKYLASGGFGDVLLYTNPHDKNDSVVLKRPKFPKNPEPSVIADKFEEAATEIRAHREIEGDGHKNIVGFKGAIRTANDELLIAIETAPGGSVSDMSYKLGGAQRSGMISADTRNLLGTFLLKGILEGTQHMQETRQAYHMDFKSPNILIAANGDPKIADFGTSGVGLNRVMTDKLRLVENPKWLAPEVVSVDYKERNSLAQNLVLKEMHQEFLPQLNSLLQMDLPKFNPEINQQAINKFVDQELIKAFRPEYNQIIAELPKHITDQFSANADNVLPKDATDTQKAEHIATQKKEYALDVLKARHPDETATFEVTRQFHQASRILNALPEDQFAPFQKLASTYGAFSRAILGEDNTGAMVDKINQIAVANSTTLNIAKGDTWSLGIVATELIKGGELNSDNIEAHEKAKINIPILEDKQRQLHHDMAALNKQIASVKDPARIPAPSAEDLKTELKPLEDQRQQLQSEIGIVREELSKAKRDLVTHIDTLQLAAGFTSDTEEAIKSFAHADIRIGTVSDSLNIREIAKRYEGDPRFQGKAYDDMFHTLESPPPPKAPPAGASAEQLEDHQKEVIHFKLVNKLDDQGYQQVQQNYSQALQQFKVVLEHEANKGVTAQDKLINGLLHPDPEKRITMSAALDSSLFKDPRLSKAAVRELIQELNKSEPDLEKIKQLEKSLAMPTR